MGSLTETKIDYSIHPRVNSADPVPPRPRPGAVTAPRKYDESPGRFYVMDVYKGTHMAGVARGAVKWLRVVESPEKRFYSSQVWSAQGIVRFRRWWISPIM